MNIIFLGAPGVGKGTQAVLTSQNLNAVHISTGDIFRKEIKDQTKIGLCAKGYIDKGQLVPDDITTEIVLNRLTQKDCENGFLLDGFPRTVPQAIALDEKFKIDAVLDIKVPLEKLMNRLIGRRVCVACKESYHVDFLDGKTTCPHCGGELIQRADDNEETVNKRLMVYKSQTQPLIDYYKAKNLWIRINGDNDAESVQKEIIEALKK